MKYLVVIDSDSHIAQMYGDALPRVCCGPGSLPAFVCTEVDTSHPHYLRMATAPTPKFESRQSIHIPHSDVVLVLEYAKDEKPPLGFVS